MKYSLLLTVCLLLGYGAFSKDTIAWEYDKKKVEVKASGLFSRDKDAKLSNSKDAPSGTMAKILAVDYYDFQWRPRWNFVGLGGVILPFALQSLDQSTLGIIESLPSKRRPHKLNHRLYESLQSKHN